LSGACGWVGISAAWIDMSFSKAFHYRQRLMNFKKNAPGVVLFFINFNKIVAVERHSAETVRSATRQACEGRS
jgi:hypothetical protein